MSLFNHNDANDDDDEESLRVVASRTNRNRNSNEHNNQNLTTKNTMSASDTVHAVDMIFGTTAIEAQQSDCPPATDVATIKKRTRTPVRC